MFSNVMQVLSRFRRLGGFALFVGVLGYLSLVLINLSIENPNYDINHQIGQLIGQQPFPNGSTCRQMLAGRFNRITAENVAPHFYVFDARFDAQYHDRVPKAPLQPRVFQASILPAEQDVAFNRMQASLLAGQQPDPTDQAAVPKNSLRLNGTPLVWKAWGPEIPWPGLIDETIAPQFFINFYTEQINDQEVVTRLRFSLPFLLLITNTDIHEYQNASRARTRVRQTAQRLEDELRTYAFAEEIPTPTTTQWTPAQIRAFYSWVGAAAVVNHCIGLRLQNNDGDEKIISALSKETGIESQNWTRALVGQLYPVVAGWFSARQRTLTTQTLGLLLIGLLGLVHYARPTPRHILYAHLNELPNRQRFYRRFACGIWRYGWLFVVPAYRTSWLDRKIKAWCEELPDRELYAGWWRHFRARAIALRLTVQFDRIKKHAWPKDVSECRRLRRLICDTSRPVKREQLRAWLDNLQKIVQQTEVRAQQASPSSLSQTNGSSNGHSSTKTWSDGRRQPAPPPHYVPNPILRQRLTTALGCEPRTDLHLSSPNITTLLEAIEQVRAVHPRLVPLLHQHPDLDRWLNDHHSCFTKRVKKKDARGILHLLLNTHVFEVMYVFRATLWELRATHAEEEDRIKAQLEAFHTLGIRPEATWLLAIDDPAARDRRLMVRRTSTDEWTLHSPTPTNGHRQLWVIATTHPEEDRKFLIDHGVPANAEFITIGHLVGYELTTHLLGGNQHTNGSR
jgi:hypothetical protein